MSADGTAADGEGDGEDGDGGPGRREVARRVFAAEYDDATVSHREGEEERAPTYVVTPGGAKANRLFFAGVLTEVESVNEEMVRARVVDPTGAFVVYAGQYQPEARATFERTDPPAFLAVTGKARTFESEDGERVFSSVRPESVNAVDAETRDRWVVGTAERTLDRVADVADELAGGADPAMDAIEAREASADGAELALAAYDTGSAYLAALRRLAVDALEVVAGDRDEVRPLSVDPDAPGSVDLDALRTVPEFGPAAGGEGPVGDATADAPDPDAGGGAEAATVDADATTPPDATADADDGVDLDDGVDAAGSGTNAGAVTDTGGDDRVDDTGGVGDSGEVGDGPGEFGGAGDGPGEFGDSAGFDDGPVDSDDGPGEFGDSGDDPGEFGGTEGFGDSGDDPGEFDDGSDEFGGTGDFDGDGPEPATDEMYEFDEEERREIESEYGTDFSTGSEVDAPGEAGIETPAAGTDPEEEAAEASTDAGTGAPDPGTAESAGDPPGVGSGDTGGDAGTAGGTDDAAGDADEVDDAADDGPDDGAEVDLESLLLDRMRELDDGDGADREELVAAVVDAAGVDPGDVEDAIQDALMGGRCYEPGDDRLKPI